MSSALAAPPPTPVPSTSPPVDAACPLCGAPLDPAQDWCLTCGAAARTRLAAPASWRAPIVAIAVTAAVALGVLAAALVKLSAGTPTPQAPPAITTTITVPATPTTESPPSTTGSASSGESTTQAAPGGATPGGTSAPGTSAPGTGAVNPGTPTTIAPSRTTGGTSGPGATGTGTKTGASHGKGSHKSSEEALRKAGFLPRTGK